MQAKQADLETVMEADGSLVTGGRFGDLAVGIVRLAPGTDLSPVLKATEGGSCPVPHWGYVVEGSWTIGYTDGTEETIQAGSAFYLPAGHDRVTTEAGCTVVEFSPPDELAAIQAEIATLMGG